MQCRLAGCTKARATLKSVSNTARGGGIEAGGDVHALEFLVLRMFSRENLFNDSMRTWNNNLAA